MDNGGKYFQHYKLLKKFTVDVQSSTYPPPPPPSQNISNLVDPPSPPPLSLDVTYVWSLIGKSRLAPIEEKWTSIPRLELQAAVTAVRLKHTCIEELKMEVDNLYFYSNLKTIINYIGNDYSNFEVFAVHRTREIRNNSEPKQWY